MTLFDIELFLLSINKDDLYRGPLRDRDIDGEFVYIFKKIIYKDILFYVKIKRDSVNQKKIKILSCHEDEN